jgi:NAD(P)-dependent dehydrogenase (short-subunit alcohol dehydrogenase family)
MVETALDAFGRLDIAVNNAGVAGRAPAHLPDVTPEAWREMMSVNLDGVFYCMRAEIPAMLSAGGGSIINMASVMGMVGTPGSAPYVASKHGVIGLTKAAALECAPRGVRINAVGPGFIDTRLLSDSARASMPAIVGRHPLGRLGFAEEVAAVVGFLASPSSSFVTGSYYAVDGGYAAQ